MSKPKKTRRATKGGSLPEKMWPVKASTPVSLLDMTMAARRKAVHLYGACSPFLKSLSRYAREEAR